MCYIHVAAHEHGLLTVETAEVVAESVVPCHAIGEAAQTVLRIGRVDRDDVKAVVFEGYYASFVVMLINAESIGHVDGLVTCEDGGAGVTFLVGVVPIAFVAGEYYIKLTRLHLRFLKAEEVCVQLREDIAEAFAVGGSQAVDVPGDKLHLITFIGC